MLIVNLLSQGGRNWSFQIPCRFAGSDPGRLEAMSRAAEARVRAKFDIQAQARVLEEWYREAIDGPAAP